MIASVRAGIVAALVALLSLSLTVAASAQKAFQRDDLADAAIKLEAQIKAEAGTVTKPVAQLRREADAAFGRNDFRTGLQLLGQIAPVAPEDGGNWLRLAKTVLQIRPGNDRERVTLLERAATAAYIGYLRTRVPAEEAEALLVISRSYSDRQLWRPALDAMRISLDLREVADVRLQYERMREDHGFRLLDYSIDADAAAPRACFQFSEDLPGRRTDLSPFVAVGGQDRPALSVDKRQICIEGLKHGERYSITLRAGIPSTVNETLSKSAEFNVYVRDRKPSVRFSSRAYVLPRTGQRGIPVVSVNTKAVAIEVYRIGDRSLLNTVIGSDFQRALDRIDIGRITEERGSQVWKGELAVEHTLNADVTTAFPVGEAIGNAAPGVYVMVANAAGAVGNEYDQMATQWFIISDLGLTTFSGNDGVHAFVNSLESTQPRGAVEVRLLARNNEVLSTKRTDDAGHVAFEANLTRGEGSLAPALIIASDARGDYAFLSLKTPAFDLSDRGVAGRVVPAGLDAFVYAERGVYRSGETVHLTALLRDPQGVAAAGTPLTLVIERPDGVEYRRTVVADQGLGGRSLDVPLVASSPTGTWRARAFTDPKRPAVGETTFMVEDYVPDRLEFNLATSAKSVSTAAPAEITLDGRYLYGAPAAGLDVEGEVVIGPASERAGFPRYAFGLSDEKIEKTRQSLESLPSTDNTGKAKFNLTIEKQPEATRALEAQLTVRMAEAGGRAVERKLVLPVMPSGPMIGVKPLFSGSSLGEGDNATFDVIVAAPDGASLARNGLRYELLRVETRYQWYRRDSSWDFEPIKTTRRVADGTINVAADTPARISVPVQWGRYRLEVTGSDGTLTTVGFDAGFYAEASADTPDLLEIALDKPEYAAGDTMTVAVTARTAGKVTLDIIGDRLIASRSQDVQAGTARLTVPVGNNWGTGAYVVATLRRPLDTRAERMPGRAIGVQWFGVNRQARTLAVGMTLPQLQRPSTTLRVPIKIGGLAAGEEARIVVAAVDVGILNLTNYKPPAPDDYYLGQRRLTADVRDLYGQLIDGMQGTRGQIKSGGDTAAAELQGSPPAQKPLALYSGLVSVRADGTADVTFDIPDFAGTARVMAVAWSKDKVGRAVSDVVIRDSVVLTATLPRFLLNGDRASMHLDLDNVDGGAGEYRIAVRSEGINVVGNAALQTLQLNAKQRSAVTVPLTAAAGSGVANVTVQVSGPAGFTLERSYALGVKPATQVIARRTVRPLARGERLTLSNDLFADLVPGTGNAALSVGLSTALDAAALLSALDRYPFGCSEQITSRAMPLLYVNEIASEANLSLDTAIDQRIRDSIDRLLARQGSNGSFGLWSSGGDDVWLDAYVSDFLTRARERGFVVPDGAFKLALDRLKNYTGNAEEPSRNGGRALAYALYVLARNGAAPLGDLRYYADTKLDDFATTIAKAQLAAALGMLGDRARAERVFTAALSSLAGEPVLEYGRIDYGSNLRDAAALVTLASEGGAQRPMIVNAVGRVEVARNLTPYISTQEQAWLVLASRAVAKEATGISLTVGSETVQGTINRSYRQSTLGAGAVTVTNTGDSTVQAVLTVTGAPTVPEPAAERGFKIERLYYTLDGKPVDASRARQNDRFTVVLKITEPQPQFGRVIVVDHLPAGFEIDNPRLVSSGETGTLGWIENALEPANAEFRDDRFAAAFNRKGADGPVFTVAYVVRAVSPGRYVHPQAYVEDMYRPDRFGRTGTGTVEVTAAR
jgi:alpha-2-macroglobulin